MIGSVMWLMYNIGYHNLHSNPRIYMDMMDNNKFEQFLRGSRI